MLKFISCTHISSLISLALSCTMYIELGLGMSKLFRPRFFPAFSVISDRHFTVKVNKFHIFGGLSSVKQKLLTKRSCLRR